MKLLDEPLLAGSANRDRSGSKEQPSLFLRTRALLRREPYGVLCTQGRGQPYGSLVAFSASADLRHLFFATMVYTRKYRLMKDNRRVSFVVDSRARFPDDMARVEAVTATGKTVLHSRGQKRRKIEKLLCKRHPQLREFFLSSSCAIIQMNVTRYFYVTRFQEVGQWVVKTTGSLSSTR